MKNQIDEILNNLSESSQQLKNQPSYSKIIAENLIIMNKKMDEIIALLQYYYNK